MDQNCFYITFISTKLLITTKFYSQQLPIRMTDTLTKCYENQNKTYITPHN